MTHDESGQSREYLLARLAAGEIDKSRFDELLAEVDALKQTVPPSADQSSVGEGDDLWDAVVSEAGFGDSARVDSSAPAQVDDAQPRFPTDALSRQVSTFDPEWNRVSHGTRFVQACLVCSLSNAILKLIDQVTRSAIISGILVPALAFFGLMFLLIGQGQWLRHRLLFNSAFGAVVCTVTVAVVVTVSIQLSRSEQTHAAQITQLMSLLALSAVIPWVFFVFSIIRQVAEHFENNRLKQIARNWLAFTYVAMVLTIVAVVMLLSDVKLGLPGAVLIVLQSGLHVFSMIWLYSLLNSVCRLIWRSKMRLRTG